jgi:hypothetical protein
MADKGWQRAFDDHIALPDGRVLKTLRDAGHYVAGLPTATQSLSTWHLAAEMLLFAAERGGMTGRRSKCRDDISKPLLDTRHV